MGLTERRSWRFVDGVLLVGLVALAVGATWPIWKSIFQRALSDPEQSHILLAPVIAAWLVWVRRERIRQCWPQWSLGGPVMIACGVGLGLVGFARGHMLFEHFGALLVVVGAAATILGFATLRRFLPAVVALLFLMPVPGTIRHQISVPLQQVTASITHAGMELLGLPVVRDGAVLQINGQEVAVAEACNGMRMVAALGLVAYAFVFSAPMRQSVRVFILAASPLVAIVCNVIRLVPTVLFYGYTSLETAEFFHDVSGWLMLLVALGFLWMLLSLLRWIEVPITPYAVASD